MIDANFLVSTFQWIGEKWENYISPLYILRCYEGGVLLRMGKYKKNLKEGVNFKIPLIDEVHVCNVAVDTLHLAPVSVTTIDNIQVSVEPIVKFNVTDVKKYLLEANEVAGNIGDVSRGTVADFLSDCTWSEIKEKKTRTAIKNALKKECEALGINVHMVYFGRIVTTKVYSVYKE